MKLSTRLTIMFLILSLPPLPVIGSIGLRYGVRTMKTEKEVLFKKVHHRVKNNMQMIQILLNLQAAIIENPLMKETLTDTNYRIKSMALIHETFYRSDNIGRLNLEHHFNQLVTNPPIHIHRGSGTAFHMRFPIQPGSEE